jgi:ankyrin repeat protein
MTVRLGILLVVLAGASILAAPADTRVIAAVKSGDGAAARRLLRQGVSAKTVDADGTTALHWAVRANDLELTRALLAAGAAPSAADRYGITPLALAALNGSAPAIDALLKAGANPNAVSGNGETVLMTAARTGRPDAVKRLLARGAKVDSHENEFGETALMWAAGQNHGEVIRLLAAAGADLNLRSAVIDLPPTKVDLATMVTTALPRGGMTALMYAAREGAVDAAAALADVKADLNVVDPEGVTALVLAIVNSHFDVAAKLAEKGANPNIGDKAGMAALYAAVDMAHPDAFINRPKATPTGPPTAAGLVEILLTKGADPNQKLKTPLLMRQHNTGDASLGDGATPLMRAAKVPDLALMRLLLDHKADPSAALKNLTTPMTIVMGGRGARTLTPETPTFQALQLLVEHGADVNATNANGETLLHQVVGRGDAVVRLVASHGANLFAKDRSGRTPLDVAMGVAPTAAAPAVGAGRGRAGRGAPGPGPGGPPQPASDSTIALLRELMAKQDEGKATGSRPQETGPSQPRTTP